MKINDVIKHCIHSKFYMKMIYNEECSNFSFHQLGLASTITTEVETIAFKSIKSKCMLSTSDRILSTFGLYQLISTSFP